MSRVLDAVLVATLVGACARACRPPRSRQDPAGGRRRTSGAVPTDEWARLLDVMAADIRGGSSTRTAYGRAVAHVRPHGEVVRPGTSLERVVGRAPTGRDEAVVATVLEVAVDLGGAAAAAVQSGAALLRERAAATAEARAHSAQARLSARVLTVVPLAFAGWSLLASGSFRSAVVTAPGLVAAGTGLACNAAGWWWMRRIIDRAAR